MAHRALTWAGELWWQGMKYTHQTTAPYLRWGLAGMVTRSTVGYSMTNLFTTIAIGYTAYYQRAFVMNSLRIIGLEAGGAALRITLGVAAQADIAFLGGRGALAVRGIGARAVASRALFTRAGVAAGGALARHPIAAAVIVAVVVTLVHTWALQEHDVLGPNAPTTQNTILNQPGDKSRINPYMIGWGSVT